MGRRKFLLMAVCVLCLMAAGCAGTDETDKSAGASVTAGEAVSGGMEAAGPASASTTAPEAPVSAETAGKVLIPYTGRRSSVVYVTSENQLPDYEGLEQYDSAYFEKHALLLVTETVSSGSIDVGIRSVDVDGAVAAVTLYHKRQPSAMGTTDMATWLLWIEVEPGLNCRWTVANPALKAAGAAY